MKHRAAIACLFSLACGGTSAPDAAEPPPSSVVPIPITVAAPPTTVAARDPCDVAHARAAATLEPVMGRHPKRHSPPP